MKLFRKSREPTQPKQCGVKDTDGQHCTLQRGHDPDMDWLKREHRRSDGATFTAPVRTAAYYPLIDGSTTDTHHHHNMPMHHHTPMDHGGGFFS